MVVDAKWAHLSIPETPDLLGLSHTTITGVYREWSEKGKISSLRPFTGRGQRISAGLFQANMKARVTQSSTHYN